MLTDSNPRAFTRFCKALLLVDPNEMVNVSRIFSGMKICKTSVTQLCDHRKLCENFFRDYGGAVFVLAMVYFSHWIVHGAWEPRLLDKDMRERLPTPDAPASITPSAERKETPPGRHAIRAHASMYQLPGNPLLTEKDFDRYEQRNKALDASLPKLIARFLGIESAQHWLTAAQLIGEAPPTDQDELRRRLATEIRITLAGKNGMDSSEVLPLVLYVSPTQRTKILITALTHRNAYRHEAAAAYIRYAPPADQVELIDIALSAPSNLTRTRALQGVEALPESQRAPVVRRGLQHPTLTVALKAAEMTEHLPPTAQLEATAMIPAVVRRGLQDTFVENIKTAALMIKYATEAEQLALREELFAVLSLELHVPVVPVTPKLGPRLSWIFQRWNVPVARDITRAFTLAKVIGEAPAEKQAELQSFIPPLLREGLAANQTDPLKFTAAYAIQYAPAEVRSAFLLALLSNRDSYLRDQAVKLICHAPDSERADLLQQAFKDRNVSVRITTVNQLKFIPESARTPFIIQALADPDLAVVDAMIDVDDCVPLADWQAVIASAMQSSRDVVIRFAASHLCYIPDEEAEKIRARYPEHFTDLIALAARSPLYEEAGTDRFTRQPFVKTGSSLTLLDRPPRATDEQSLREKAVIRTIPLTTYFPWRRAFEAADVWKAHGFDYVPIEPILRVSSKHHAMDIDVATGVINGPNAKTWQDSAGTCMGEIIETIDKIDKVLEELGIEHKHSHYGNFVLLFNRDEDGSPILTTPPRVYLIDFDQAETKLPKA